MLNVFRKLVWGSRVEIVSTIFWLNELADWEIGWVDIIVGIRPEMTYP